MCLQQTPSSNALRTRDPAPPPGRFDVRDDDGRLDVSWHWWTSATPAELVAGLIGMVAAAMIGLAEGRSLVTELFALIGGGASAYFFLAPLLNRSRLRYDGDRLALTHGPLPWPSASWARADVLAVDAVREEVRTRGGRETVFHVQLNAAGERRHRFRPAFRDERDAAFLAELLTRHFPPRWGK